MSDDRSPLPLPRTGAAATLAAWRWPLAIALAALALRLVHVGWGLPSVYEEATPLKKAWDMWGFGPLRSFDLNPHWFQYPSLVFYLQLLVQALVALLLLATGAARSVADLNRVYLTDPTAFYLAGRGLTALFGAATVLPVWALARRAGGTRAAVVAALLVALHPGLVAKSQVVEVDVPLVFLVALGLARAVAHDRSTSRRDWLVSGAIAGLATSAKYPGAILVLPFALAAWEAPRAGARAPRPAPAPATRRRDARAAARRGAAPGAAPPSGPAAWFARMLPFTAAFAVALFATSPYLLLDRGETARDLAIGRQLMTLGHFGVSAGAAYATYARDWFGAFLGPVLGLASLAGLAWGAARGERWALVLASLALPFALVVGSWQMKADRYLLPLVPVAAVAAGWLFARLADLARPRAAQLARLLPALGGLACAVPLALMLPPYWRTLGTDTRAEARRWIEANLPAGSYVASELYGPDLLSPMDLLTMDGTVPADLGPRAASRPLDALQVVPMFVMAPERSAKYYDLARYARADAFVVTSAIRERYRGDASRYAVQVSFYDTLARRWPLAARFEPRGGPGPVIEVYRNPAVSACFAARPAPAAPDSVIAVGNPLTGAEAFWYLDQGLAEELAGHAAAAEGCYRLALRFGASEPAQYARVALRLAGLEDAEGRHDEARGTLRACALRAPSRGVARSLLAALDALRAGKPVCVRIRP